MFGARMAFDHVVTGVLYEVLRPRHGLKLWQGFLGPTGTSIGLSEGWTVRVPGRSSLSHFACCVTTGPIARGEDHDTPGVDDRGPDASGR
jgi:hypothetical protein